MMKARKVWLFHFFVSRTRIAKKEFYFYFYFYFLFLFLFQYNYVDFFDSIPRYWTNQPTCMRALLARVNFHAGPEFRNHVIGLVLPLFYFGQYLQHFLVTHVALVKDIVSFPNTQSSLSVALEILLLAHKDWVQKIHAQEISSLGSFPILPQLFLVSMLNCPQPHVHFFK